MAPRQRNGSAPAGRLASAVSLRNTPNGTSLRKIVLVRSGIAAAPRQRKGAPRERNGSAPSGQQRILAYLVERFAAHHATQPALARIDAPQPTRFERGNEAL